jgi:hypothetical protein
MGDKRLPIDIKQTPSWMHIDVWQCEFRAGVLRPANWTAELRAGCPATPSMRVRRVGVWTACAHRAGGGPVCDGVSIEAGLGV